MRRRADRRTAVLAVGLLAGVAGPGRLAAELVDRIVLRVNGEIATLVEYEQRRAARVEQLAQSSRLTVEERRQQVAEAGRTTLKEMFEELLILSRAKQLRLEATPAQIDRAVESARRNYGIESEAALIDELAKAGMTIEEFRARAARTLLMNQVFEREVQARAVVSDEEVARYWRDHAAELERPEQRRVEEVVVSDEAAGEQARARAAEVARRAAEVPLDEAAAGGGEGVSGVIEHGWVERGALAPELDAAVFALPEGGISAPLAARGGWHVLRVTEIRPAGPRPLAEVADQIRAQLGQQRFEARLREFLDEQARLAYVVEDVPADAVGYRGTVTGTPDPLRDLLGAPRVESPGRETETPAPPALEPETPAPAGDTPTPVPPAAPSEPPPADRQ